MSAKKKTAGDLVLFDDFLKLEEFIRPKPPASLHAHRVNPEFGRVPFTLNVDMWRLLAVIRVERTGMAQCAMGLALGKNTRS